jgi:hypothetical protein
VAAAVQEITLFQRIMKQLFMSIEEMGVFYKAFVSVPAGVKHGRERRHHSDPAAKPPDAPLRCMHCAHFASNNDES